jgi:tetratricopeptide (TPR) repeat protein
VPVPASLPADAPARLRRAAAALSRYGGRSPQWSAEPVFTHLPELTDLLRWATDLGDHDDLVLALPVADALGATWERVGQVARGRAALDALLDAVAAAGVADQPGVAVVLRRRARLAMRARDDAAAEQDLRRAYAIAVHHDDDLAVRVMLDRADLALSRGDRPAAEHVVAELCRLTEATGDPLLQAMGRNRAGWAAVARQDLAAARRWYEDAWALAELHEDAVVESRTAAGLALVDTLTDETERARAFWARALKLSQRLHDRSLGLHCLDGVAVLLAMTGAEAEALRLVRSSTAVRRAVDMPREAVLDDLHRVVLRRAQAVPAVPSLPVLSWTEALAAAGQLLTSPR